MRSKDTTLKMLVTIVASAACMASSFAAEIAVRQIQADKYELVLTNSTQLSEADAKAVVANAAKSICKGMTPVLGKYKYESAQPIVDNVGSKTGTYRFAQEVVCAAAASTTATVPAALRRPILKNEAESRQAQEEVQAKSEAYFKLLNSGKIDEAYGLVSSQMGVEEKQWKANHVSFKKLTGEPIEISIKKITVYDNPAEAQEPGLYIAADYSNVYRDVPIHCGYLMWFRSATGEFRIIREETGSVTSEQLKKIPSDQLPEIKRSLRCP